MRRKSHDSDSAFYGLQSGVVRSAQDEREPAFDLYTRKPWHGGDWDTDLVDLWYGGYKVFYNDEIDAAAIATRYFRLN